MLSFVAVKWRCRVTVFQVKRSVSRVFLVRPGVVLCQT